MRGRFTAKLHARRMYHVTRFQFSARRDRRSAHRHLADVIAFLLNFRAALSSDCSRHSASKLQIVVCSVHNGIDVHLRQIALDNLNFIGKVNLQENSSSISRTSYPPFYFFAASFPYSYTPRPAFRPVRPAFTYCTSSGHGRYFSPNVSCKYSRLFSRTSNPTRSTSSNGPIGWFSPNFSALSMSSALATPSCSI